MIKVENYLLGMDCGTTNIKAVIIGEDGTVAAEASRPNCFICPGPGMQEQDAGRWWENSVEIFRALCEEAGTGLYSGYHWMGAFCEYGGRKAGGRIPAKQDTLV